MAGLLILCCCFLDYFVTCVCAFPNYWECVRNILSQPYQARKSLMVFIGATSFKSTLGCGSVEEKNNN